jgi:hypothetical protein
MIDNTLAHGQHTHSYLPIVRIACLFIVDALLAAFLGSLTILSPVIEPAASPAPLRVTKLTDTQVATLDRVLSLHGIFPVQEQNSYPRFCAERNFPWNQRYYSHP